MALCVLVSIHTGMCACELPQGYSSLEMGAVWSLGEGLRSGGGGSLIYAGPLAVTAEGRG